jgi:signal transduction histidine kinase
MHRASTHLLHVVSSILDFSKLEAKRTELNLTDLDLNQLVSETVEPLERIAEAKATHIVVVPGDGDCRVRGDSVRIAQVIMNLVGNAIKFSDGRGDVTIEVRAEADACVLCVTDPGIGIAPDDQKRIFQSFSQIDSSNTRRFGGTGLGLSISKHLVELHSGRIWLESELGRGSSFFVRLPRQGPVPATTAPPVGVAAVSTSRSKVAQVSSEVS